MQGKARGKDIPDIKFKVSDDIYKFGMPEVQSQQQNTDSPPLRSNRTREEIDNIMKKHLPNSIAKSQSALKEAIKKSEGVGSNTAHAMITDALQLGIIERDKVSQKVLYNNTVKTPSTESPNLFDMGTGDENEMPF